MTQASNLFQIGKTISRNDLITRLFPDNERDLGTESDLRLFTRRVLCPKKFTSVILILSEQSKDKIYGDDLVFDSDALLEPVRTHTDRGEELLLFFEHFNHHQRQEVLEYAGRWRYRRQFPEKGCTGVRIVLDRDPLERQNPPMRLYSTEPDQKQPGSAETDGCQ